MSPYQLQDEDEEERRLLEEYLALDAGLSGDIGSMAPAPDSPAAPRAMEPSAPAQQLTSPPRQLQSTYEAPPEASPMDKQWLWIAAALDMALNEGTGAPQYMAQLARPDNTRHENWERRNKAKSDASARDYQAQMAEARSRGTQRDTLSRERWEAEQKRLAEENDPASQISRQTQDAFVTAGLMDEATARTMGAKQLRELRPQIGASHMMERRGEQWVDQQGRRTKDAMRLQGRGHELQVERMDYGAELDNQQADKKHARELEHKEAASQIPGWARDEGAPPLSEQNVNNARNAVVALNKLRTSVSKLQQLRSQIGAVEMAQAKLGKLSPNMARAEQEVQNAANSIREVANFGTPQAGEMAITYARVPEMATLDSWINGAVKYDALLQSLEGQVGAQMQAYGYRQGAPAPPRRPEGGASRGAPPAPDGETFDGGFL